MTQFNSCFKDNLPPVSSFIRELAPKKSLGQNFLQSPELLMRIAHKAHLSSSDVVLEVGCGPGGLTRALLSQGCCVHVLELDPRTEPLLNRIQQAYPGQLSYTLTNAKDIAWRDLPVPCNKVVANLPYNVGTELLIHWLKSIYSQEAHIESLTLMFQKEVGQRLIAKPVLQKKDKGEHYGRLSILTQYLCQVERIMELSPGAFFPPPKVKSWVMHLTPRENLFAISSLDNLEFVTQLLFSQRRKMLRQHFHKRGLILTDEDLSHLHINPTLRPENLTLEQFCQLTFFVPPFCT